MESQTAAEAWAGWIIRVGLTPINTGRCRGCDALVLWCLTVNDRRTPIDRDGLSHFATCPEADRFRRRPNRGDRPSSTESSR